MALQLILDTLDGLDESLAAEYVEKDGKFFLDTIASGGLAVEDVTGLKNTVSTLRTEKGTLQTQLNAFKDIDPEAAKVALGKMDEIANWDGDTKAKEMIEANKVQLIAAHKKDFDAEHTKRTAAESQLEKNLVKNAAMTALQKAEANITLMSPHVLASCRMKQAEDGTYIAEVVDSSGNVRVGDSQGNPMTIPQLVEEMKANPDFASGFNGTGSSGGGAGGSGSGKDTGSRRSGSKIIQGSDQNAMNQSIEDIASGKVSVDMNS